MSKPYRVLLTGGGTGGHVYPCLSIYQLLKERHFVGEALFLGVKGRAEERIVPRYGIALDFITSSPVAGTSLGGLIRSVGPLLRGTVMAMRKILKFRPNLVIGTGGYVSAPVLFASFILKPFLPLTIVVEEQNLVPGLLNKLASLLADVVLVNFKKSVYFTWHKRAVFVGYPLRPEYKDLSFDRKTVKQSLGIPDDTVLILVTGGSLGARSLNRVVASSIDEIGRLGKIMIIHSIGLSDVENYHAVADTVALMKASLGERFDERNLTARNEDGRIFWQGFPFIHTMFDYQKAADLVISRAGAGTIAEIAATGTPAVLIPKRGLPGDHQELNAITIAERGGCEIIFERRDRQARLDYIDTAEFMEVFRALLDSPNRRESLGRQIREIHEHTTDELIYTTIDRITRKAPVNFIDEIIEPQFVQFQRSFDHLILYLDKVRRQNDLSNPYLRFYTRKIDEYLASKDFLVVNKGIKLIGALQRSDRYPWLIEHFDHLKGFLRRNALICLQKAAAWDPSFRSLLIRGLTDSYYEVRREAVNLFLRFPDSLKNDPQVKEMILARLKKPLECFEVKGEALKALIFLVDEPTFFRLTERFLVSRNVRYRESLLEAIKIGLVNHRIAFDDHVKIFLKRMMITTSEFKPEFKIRESYLTVLKELEGVSNGQVVH